MDVWGYELVILIFCMHECLEDIGAFIVQEVNARFEASLFQQSLNGLVRFEEIWSCASFDWFGIDGVRIVVVGHQGVFVAASGGNGETTGLICVNFSGLIVYFHVDIMCACAWQSVIDGQTNVVLICRWEWRSVIKRCVGGSCGLNGNYEGGRFDLICILRDKGWGCNCGCRRCKCRLGFCGSCIFVCLTHMTFSCFFAVREVLLYEVDGETRPSCEEVSFDGGYPCTLRGT